LFNYDLLTQDIQEVKLLKITLGKWQGDTDKLLKKGNEVNKLLRIISIFSIKYIVLNYQNVIKNNLESDMEQNNENTKL